MKTKLSKLISTLVLGLVILPSVLFAQEASVTGDVQFAEPQMLQTQTMTSSDVSDDAVSPTLALIIRIAEYLSILAFFAGTILLAIVVQKFGKSMLGAIFTHMMLGTAVFIFISLYIQLGSEFFGITEQSFEIMWHIMFYVGAMLYYVGLRSLVGLGSSDINAGQMASASGSKKWAVVGIVAIAFVFAAPKLMESILSPYAHSKLSDLGLHHFISFALAAFVASYLFSAKKKMGQIGQAIANPMLLVVTALSLQHFWELLTESWAVLTVQGVIIEGVEQIFLMVAGIAITVAAIRLRSFVKNA